MSIQVEISKEKALFVVEKVEMAFDQINDDVNSVLSKSKWTLGAVGLAATYCIDKFISGLPGSFQQYFFGIESVILCILGVGLVAFCSLPKIYKTKGAKPLYTLDPEWISQSFSDVLTGYAKLMDDDMEHNQAHLITISNWLKRLTIAAAGSPLLAGFLASMFFVRG